ncbi:hypothetical protein FBD94_15450 [Pedobacter hiemivivus]|uniref:Uncharacterized protein n=1 Tax=Pedobacter hiemivivus TaxID=2530454 RepID=A0A4U1GBM3_9SPHI|nr:hypothetical protein [Pedobacter hiemivivus]TKC60299.1 hypothetical protein FBD94_15450 [Pedobacter hiemivivus]
MIKAGALYIVVIVSLLIAMISASLLTIAFYYRQEVQKKTRFDKLLVNLESGTAVLLSEGFNYYDEAKSVDLFEDQKDSLVLKKELWGVYELNTVKAFEAKDTLKRAFFSGDAFTDPNAIYLADEDRPLSVSGNTQITGDGQLPKSGLKQAYVEGKPYAGKELIYGAIKNSDRGLPVLNDKLIQEIEANLKTVEGLPFFVKDSISCSFFNATDIYKLAATQMNLGSRKLNGKIILVSDTTVNIDADTRLDHVQIYAPAIIVAGGFKGSCQLFARDSIIIGKNCVFDYPSFAGIFKPEESKIQAKLSLGEGGRFSGVLFSYEKTRSPLQTIISLAKNCKVNGEVYATAYVKMEKTTAVYGKTSAKRFIMQTPTTLYENYLIDITLNRKMLSKYYLSSSIFKRDHREQRILRWLN